MYGRCECAQQHSLPQGCFGHLWLFAGIDPLPACLSVSPFQGSACFPQHMMWGVWVQKLRRAQVKTRCCPLLRGAVRAESVARDSKIMGAAILKATPELTLASFICSSLCVITVCSACTYACMLLPSKFAHLHLTRDFKCTSLLFEIIMMSTRQERGL
jgi:hypothetical protein